MTLDGFEPVAGVDNETEEMDLQKFIDFGYLQEVNRLFFHPLNLVLCVTKRGDTYSLGPVISCPNGKGGLRFRENGIDPKKANAVLAVTRKNMTERVNMLGGIVEDADTLESWDNVRSRKHDMAGTKVGGAVMTPEELSKLVVHATTPLPTTTTATTSTPWASGRLGIGIEATKGSSPRDEVCYEDHFYMVTFTDNPRVSVQDLAVTKTYDPFKVTLSSKVPIFLSSGEQVTSGTKLPFYDPEIAGRNEARYVGIVKNPALPNGPHGRKLPQKIIKIPAMRAVSPDDKTEEVTASWKDPATGETKTSTVKMSKNELDKMRMGPVSSRSTKVTDLPIMDPSLFSKTFPL